MTAPAEAAVEVVEQPESADSAASVALEADEMRVNFPLLAIENFDTADGRFITADALTARALPLTLLAVTRSSHGGQQPEAAHTVGRIDFLERVPGPDVVSKVTGEPFPEGSFVWRGSGVVSTTKTIDGDNIADLIRRRYVRGVSADLVPSDFEIYGDDAMAPDAPTRRAAVHKADLSGATILPIPAFGDCSVEIADDEPVQELAPDPAELGLVASAFPAWRSAEIGDYPALTAAVSEGPVVVTRWPANAADTLTEWIAEDEGEPRDAAELAAHIDAQVRANWMPDAEDDPDDELAMTAAAPALDEPVSDVEAETVEDVGMPDAPQDCADDQSEPHPAAMSLLFDEGERYVATCAEHEDAARAQIAERGAEVTQVVQIDQPDTDAEETPA